MTLWAWSSVMRNSAFSTVTTNSRGVKSSLTRITLCSRGRSTLVLVLVFGLVTVFSAIPEQCPDAVRSRVPLTSARAAVRQTLRQGLIAAADGDLDQFTGSGPIVKLGVCREFERDQGLHRAGFVEFRSLRGVVEQMIGVFDPDRGIGCQQLQDLDAGVVVVAAGKVDQAHGVLDVPGHPFALER